ncbi:GNAT family N-acetyltransferase [Brevibacterium samyangense]|uniref:GNAT family N-acetyltransferase n=1 Tax=Brevibacterium samyangense TaxID=366888 RepID=A0ABP5EHD5_9MICO
MNDACANAATITTARGEEFRIRGATGRDAPAVVRLLADDMLGRDREGDTTPSALAPYDAAFALIDRNPNAFLGVVCDTADPSTIQLDLLPGLSRGGTTRLQMEAVRIASTLTGSGVGSAVFDWIHDYGRRHGATLVQLTTDEQRSDAHRFYEKLGYLASHEGMKRSLES